MFYISSVINYGISAISTLYTIVLSQAGNLPSQPLQISIGAHNLAVRATNIGCAQW